MAFNADLTTDNAEAMEQIEKAASLHLLEPAEHIDVYWEHDQYWVTVTRSTGEFLDDPVNYSVVEAHGYNLTIQGIDFEEV